MNRPLPLSTLPRAGGARAVGFIEKFIRVPKGKGARKPFKVRPWQRELIGGVFNKPRPRSALWSLPRGNGKSAIAATLGLYGLFGDGVEGAHVVVVAADERQASGDARLARHVSHAVVKTDSRGTRLAKEHKHSRRRIDLAVAAVMAHDRARALASRPRAAIYVLD
jgi:phage terminase large subunit-like protein